MTTKQDKNILNWWKKFFLGGGLDDFIVYTDAYSDRANLYSDMYQNQYEKWELDKFGCSGERMKMVRLLVENKEEFFRYRQNQIIDILGKPDNLTLYERGQTIYFYYIKYHPNCPNVPYRAEEERIKLELRFDALNRSKELYVYNY